MVNFLNLCKIRKQEILSRNDLKLDNFNDNNLEILEDKKVAKQENLELGTIVRVECLIESLFSGLSYTYGLNL